MVEFLPFLLIMLAWETHSPEETMALGVELMVDEATCDRQGKLLIEDYRASPSEPDYGYRYFCIPLPTSEDYDRVLEQLR